jgi:hypothetical protein
MDPSTSAHPLRPSRPIPPHPHQRLILRAHDAVERIDPDAPPGRVSRVYPRFDRVHPGRLERLRVDARGGADDERVAMRWLSPIAPLCPGRASRRVKVQPMRWGYNAAGKLVSYPPDGGLHSPERMLFRHKGRERQEHLRARRRGGLFEPVSVGARGVPGDGLVRNDLICLRLGKLNPS